MTPVDYAVLIAVVSTVGGAVAYIVRAKKKGKKCIGCPHAGTCGKSNCTCQTSKTPDGQTE